MPNTRKEIAKRETKGRGASRCKEMPNTRKEIAKREIRRWRGAGDRPSETKMREDPGKFGRVQEDAERCGEMWGDLGRFGRVQEDAGIFGKMREDAGRCRKMQEDAGRYSSSKTVICPMNCCYHLQFYII